MRVTSDVPVYPVQPPLSTPSHSATPNRGRRILFVGECADEREMYAVRFRSQGFCTLQARTAFDAYRLASELSPAVIITDIRLAGEEDGVALARRFRDTPEMCGMKVVILTSYVRPDDRTRLREDACDLLLVKPCLPETLLRAAEQLIHG